MGERTWAVHVGEVRGHEMVWSPVLAVRASSEGEAKCRAKAQVARSIKASGGSANPFLVVNFAVEWAP